MIRFIPPKLFSGTFLRLINYSTLYTSPDQSHRESDTLTPCHQCMCVFRTFFFENFDAFAFQGPFLLRPSRHPKRRRFPTRHRRRHSTSTMAMRCSFIGSTLTKIRSRCRAPYSCSERSALNCLNVDFCTTFSGIVDWTAVRRCHCPWDYYIMCCTAWSKGLLCFRGI